MILITEYPPQSTLVHGPRKPYLWSYDPDTGHLTLLYDAEAQDEKDDLTGMVASANTLTGSYMVMSPETEEWLPEQ